MNMMEQFQEISDAVAEAQRKESYAQAASETLASTRQQAQAVFDATVGKAQADFDAANEEYRDAREAVSRLKAQLDTALGGLFAAPDPRVRQSR